jgi:hypothetical protein
VRPVLRTLIGILPKIGRSGPVVTSQAPEDVAGRILIATGEGVLVVEDQLRLQSGFGIRTLFEDFFASEHTQVFLHPSFAQQLVLCGISELIVSLC